MLEPVSNPTASVRDDRCKQPRATVLSSERLVVQPIGWAIDFGGELAEHAWSEWGLEDIEERLHREHALGKEIQ